MISNRLLCKMKNYLARGFFSRPSHQRTVSATVVTIIRGNNPFYGLSQLISNYLHSLEYLVNLGV